MIILSCIFSFLLSFAEASTGMGHVTHLVNAAIKAETPKDRALAGEYENMKLISHNETIYI